MGHVFIVTHTDLDGVGSAAVYVRLSGLSEGDYTVMYAEPYNIDSVLGDIEPHIEGGDKLVIADLGPNRESFPRAVNIVSELTRRNVRVEWYDHHIWAEDEIAALEKAGAHVVVDRSTCATGVVARHAPQVAGVSEPDSFTEELVAAVCAADLWKWDHPMAPKLFRVVGERGAEEWKTRMVSKFASGVLWDDEMAEKLEEYVNLELEGFKKVVKTIYVAEKAACRVAGAYKENGPPSNSFIGAMLLSRYRADIAVIVRPNGAISLRSRNADVQVIAKSLGGGGHPRASGARIRIPFYIKLLGALSKKFISKYVTGKIAKVAVDVDSCKNDKAAARQGAEVKSAAWNTY